MNPHIHDTHIHGLTHAWIYTHMDPSVHGYTHTWIHLPMHGSTNI